ncbi:DUF445 domain-containing protein [Chitinophagaceae bacterium MMS25-I14]
MDKSSGLKLKKLRQFKMLALLLLLLMAIIYAISTAFISVYQWLGYVRAFSEAAMVGALADWFAVTALFHYPLGIPIPHTNLIENSKHSIGGNLGNFVVQNFITPDVIRPKLEQFSIAGKLAEWLQKDSNQELLVDEIVILLEDIVDRTDKSQLAAVIKQQSGVLAAQLNMPAMLAGILDYIAEGKKYEPILDAALSRFKQWVVENEELVREAVKKESSALIPGFVDNIIARKISGGLIHLISDVRQDPEHHIRKELEAQFISLIDRVRTDEHVKGQLDDIKQKFLSDSTLSNLSEMLTDKILDIIRNDLKQPESGIHQYIKKTISDIALQLVRDGEKGKRLDQWIRFHAFRLIMKNRVQAGVLISNTVGNWNGADLSRKLELEVGKDLQFIRINGTIVGGLVGLLIYIITQLLHGV